MTENETPTINIPARFFELLSQSRCPECGSPTEEAVQNESDENSEFTISCTQCVFVMCGTGNLYTGD